jgi:hypothetical protein
VDRGGERLRPQHALPLLGALALVAFAVAAVVTAETLARGSLLPYTSMTVERVRVLGEVELWVAREEATRLDVLNAVILGAGAVAMLGAAVRARRAAAGTRHVRFLALLALGLGFLALDESLALHETLGYNLGFLADLPGVSSPEDVVFALYAVPAVAFFLAYRDLLAASRLGLRLVALGVALFLAAAALDVTDALLDEQWVEPLGSLALVSGLCAVAVRLGTRSSSLRADAGERGGDRPPAARA